MAKNNRLRAVVGKQIQESNAFNAFEKFVLNCDKDKEAETPHVNLKYYTPSFECISSWEEEYLKAFSSFIEKMRLMKWSDIYKTGGSLGHKTGVGYTILDKKKYPKNQMLDTVSEDITFFELRIDKTARVHGFRCLDAFYLVYLDKSHQICP